tara:strand:- start:179 stop:553 length:375 start_codon:yes stop_codon:yes gene_type:complete
MSLKDRLLELQKGKEKYSFSIPGLADNGEPLKVFYSQLTVREDTRLRKQYPEFYKQLQSGDLPSFQAIVDLIIMKLTNEEGVKVFGDDDRSYLLGMDVKFITDIGAKLLENIFDVPDVEQAEKN